MLWNISKTKLILFVKWMSHVQESEVQVEWPTTTDPSTEKNNNNHHHHHCWISTTHQFTLFKVRINKTHVYYWTATKTNNVQIPKQFITTNNSNVFLEICHKAAYQHHSRPHLLTCPRPLLLKPVPCSPNHHGYLRFPSPPDCSLYYAWLSCPFVLFVCLCTTLCGSDLSASSGPWPTNLPSAFEILLPACPLSTLAVHDHPLLLASS